MSTKEIWIVAPSLPTHEVSSWGRIRKIPHFMPMPNGGLRQYGGQPHYGTDSGEGRVIYSYKNKTYKLHRLICEAFNGPPKRGKNICMHLDSNYKNNTPENLAWGTQKENLNHQVFLEYCRSRVGNQSPVVKGLKKKIDDNHNPTDRCNSYRAGQSGPIYLQLARCCTTD